MLYAPSGSNRNIDGWLDGWIGLHGRSRKSKQYLFRCIVYENVHIACEFHTLDSKDVGYLFLLKQTSGKYLYEPI
jgi:hypothetical protein